MPTLSVPPHDVTPTLQDRVLCRDKAVISCWLDIKNYIFSSLDADCQFLREWVALADDDHGGGDGHRGQGHGAEDHSPRAAHQVEVPARPRLSATFAHVTVTATIPQGENIYT